MYVKLKDTLSRLYTRVPTVSNRALSLQIVYSDENLGPELEIKSINKERHINLSQLNFSFLTFLTLENYNFNFFGNPLSPNFWSRFQFQFHVDSNYRLLRQNLKHGSKGVGGNSGILIDI